MLFALLMKMIIMKVDHMSLFIKKGNIRFWHLELGYRPTLSLFELMFQNNNVGVIFRGGA